MKTLKQLNPQPLFSYFENICRVPRPSKKEEKIRKFLLDFAKENTLSSKTDDAGNVLILKPASPGKEGAPTVILQTHMDMVCEKNSDKVFDFENDPIEPIISGGWVKANGTTLGADCGIGIAAQMAVLTAGNISHGPLECLITVDEETGLTGAFALKSGFLSGSILLNLDSEDEGELFIGCAGGIDTQGVFTFQKNDIPENSGCLKLTVSGLLGGHSGDDIHKNRGNAIKILTRFLWNAAHDYPMQLADFNGGNLRNAIAREATALIVVPERKIKSLSETFERFAQKIKFEFEKNEPNLKLAIEKTDLPDYVIDANTQKNLLNALYACPHGILEMSTRMEGMVETSTNLASVKVKNESNIDSNHQSAK
jgi:dipeptidase D